VVLTFFFFLKVKIVSFSSQNCFKEPFRFSFFKKKKKGLDNFKGFQIFRKENSQQLSVLLVLIKITSQGFQ
jgi:hypothetical protein